MDPDFHLYRLVRPDGTGKEWGYRINGDGTVTTQWRKAFAAGKFRIKTRKMDGIELDSRIRSKESKGYRRVSSEESPKPSLEERYCPDDQWHKQSMEEWLEERQPSPPKINELIDDDERSFWF